MKVINTALLAGIGLPLLVTLAIYVEAAYMLQFPETLPNVQAFSTKDSIEPSKLKLHIRLRRLLYFDNPEMLPPTF